MSAPATANPRALDGVRVVDFSSIVAGPWCTRLLADCGADVIKIEPVGDGDLMRFVPPLVDGVSAVFAQFNCGKRSVTLDLKTTDGLALARRLAASADIVVENFRPGVMARMGLGYADLAAQNPKLIYCSVSGFGQSGPRAGDAAYAPVVHALSGFDIAFQRAQAAPGAEVANDAVPPCSGIMVADVVAAIYAFGAIQTALVQRERHGIGSHVDTTLLDSMISLLGIQYQEAQSDPPLKSAVFRPTPTLDGHVMVPVVSMRNYLSLYPVIGRDDWLKDARFTTMGGAIANKPEIEAALNAWARDLPTDTVIATLGKAGLACAPYRSAGAMLDDAHLRERGSFTTLASGRRVSNPPFRLSASDCTVRPWVAGLGEHTREVLAEALAVPAAELDRLSAGGVFG
ncbi:CaiB/BaiF CoA transferase family protein [Zavarzinia sp. CC-PAN008]|uniref:CaiB/BaiF CoA transferase family protein n=1 Tax=Zavarzinia sp. CC-PAN008 TaxID=3243332 RepID=UPI003F746ACA